MSSYFPCSDAYGFPSILILCCNKKHLKNVGPIRHCESLHAALPFTRCRYCRTPPLSHATCASMFTTTTTTTTMTTRDRGDRYGSIEWAQSTQLSSAMLQVSTVQQYSNNGACSNTF